MDGVRAQHNVDEIRRLLYLLVGPLLIVSEAIVEPWLVQMVRQTRDRLIQKEELPRFEKLIARSIRWRDSYIVEILLFLSTFGWQWLEVRVLPQPAAASWHQLPSSGAPTYAFLWCLYLAKPLVRFLWLRWIWRYLLWSFLLIRLSSFQLKIAPEYPDRHGGLEFIAIAHGRFAALALTFAAQVASIFGEQILFEGRTLASFRYEIIGVVVIVLLTLLTPLLAFTGKLLVAKRIALLDYGMLADQYTSAFHARWIHGARGSEQILGTPDIQSLADLDNSYQIVRGMNISLISKDIILTFVVATLLPFVPLLLIVYPLDELIKHLLKAVI